MSNPNNAVGTNAAYSGRTSVNAFNDGLAAYGRGILSGWVASPSTGLKVQLGGTGTVRDVAVAVDNAGNRTTINNISGAPIEMTISAAPSTNSRIDAIVAYVDNPAEGVSTVADNPAACGMIVVKGNAAASPVEPNETMIRSAITADGASGVTAYYVILATVTIASGTTDLTSGNIAAGPSAGIGAKNIDFSSFANSTTQVISLGNILIEYGVCKITAPNNTDSRLKVTFTQQFKTIPKVLVTCNSWLSITKVWADSISTQDFYCGVSHSQGSTRDIYLSWLAIG